MPCHINEEDRTARGLFFTKCRYQTVEILKLPRTCSHSTIDGRNGSNACGLISTHFALSLLNSQIHIQFPQNSSNLSYQLSQKILQSIRIGNRLHEENFPPAQNLSPEDINVIFPEIELIYSMDISTNHNLAQNSQYFFNLEDNQFIIMIKWLLLVCNNSFL